MMVPQPKYIAAFIAMQKAGNFDIVSGTRYSQGGYVYNTCTRC
jgi:hypothetical protein